MSPATLILRQIERPPEDAACIYLVNGTDLGYREILVRIDPHELPAHDGSWDFRHWKHLPPQLRGRPMSLSIAPVGSPRPVLPPD